MVHVPLLRSMVTMALVTPLALFCVPSEQTPVLAASRCPLRTKIRLKRLGGILGAQRPSCRPPLIARVVVPQRGGNHRLGGHQQTGYPLPKLAGFTGAFLGRAGKCSRRLRNHVAARCGNALSPSSRAGWGLQVNENVKPHTRATAPNRTVHTSDLGLLMTHSSSIAAKRRSADVRATPLHQRASATGR